MQDNDIRWFITNYGALHKKYGNGFLAIKNEKVLGKYKTSLDAYNNTIKTEMDGTFVVQECRGKQAPKVVPLCINSFSVK